MALSQSALSELLEAFRTGDGVDMIRESVRTVLQELVEFEAAGVIAPKTASPNATAPAPSCWPPRPATSKSGSPSSARAPTSPPSSSRADASTRRSTRS